MSQYDLGPCTSAPPAYYAGESQAKMVQMPTLKQRLDLAVLQAEEKLKTVKEAREVFDRNPDMEKLLNLMQRGLF